MNTKPKKHCPFCGKYILYSDVNPMHTKRQVICANCQARGSEIDYENIPEYGGWDNRPLEEALQKQLEEMASCLQDCLTIMEEHGNKIIMSHATIFSNAYTALYTYQKTKGFIK